MQQHILEITIPDGVKWYGSDFRKTIGSVSNGSLNPIIFNKDENNRPLNRHPKCFFVNTSKTVRFISEREEGNLDVAAVMPFAFMAAQKHFNDPAVKIKTYTVAKNALPTFEPLQYLLISASKKKRNEQALNKSTKQIVEEMVIRELENAYYTGAISDLPEREQINLTVLEANEIGMKIHNSGNEYGGLIRAKFMMNIDLNGFWQAGNLKSKGYGRIIKCNAGFTRP